MAHLTAPGSSQYLTTPNVNALDLTGAHTIVAWVKPGTLASGEYAFFITKRGGSGGNYQAYLNFDTGVSERRMKYWNGTTVITGSTDTAFSDNIWQHFGFVHDGTNINFYLDGLLKDTQAEANSGAVEEDFYINFGTGTVYGEGTVAEVAIWTTNLSTPEMVSLAVGYSPLFIQPQNLVAYWPLVRGLNDKINSLNLTAPNGSTVSAHSRIIYPSRLWTPHKAAAPVGAAGIMTTNTGYWGPIF